jgi:hypothetical protein
MIFIGYESGPKAYRMYDLVTKHVHVTHDMVFNKQDQWDWGTGDNDDEPSGGDDIFMVEYATISQVALEIEWADEEPAEQSPLPATDNDTEVDNDIDNLDANHNNAEVGDDVDNDNLDADHDDDRLLGFRSINNILRMAEFVTRALVVEELHMVSSDEPTSFTKAERRPSWRKVVMEEMKPSRRMTLGASSINHLIKNRSRLSGCSRWSGMTTGQCLSTRPVSWWKATRSDTTSTMMKSSRLWLS